MTSTVPIAAMWIPVVATLFGAVVGFFASVALAWLNHKKLDSKELSQRQRERLEDLYKTLALVRKDYQGLLGGSIVKIHGGADTPQSTHEGIPPIFIAEMLVKLYFAQLDEVLVGFLSARDKFGKEWGALIGSTTTSWPDQKRKEKVSQFLDLFEQVDNAIEAFQSAIAKTIKA